MEALWAAVVIMLTDDAFFLLWTSLNRIPLVFPVFGKGKAPHVTAALPQHGENHWLIKVRSKRLRLQLECLYFLFLHCNVGFARISLWKLLNSSDDADTVTAEFGLDHTLISEENRKLWPFDFSLVYTVKLAAETIETKLRVHNVGDKSFDFNTLLHTYFLIPVSLSL